MQLEPGQSAEVRRRFSPADVASYTDLGGHEPTQGEIPEPLIDALFSYLLGVELPGSGTNYLKQESKYIAVAHIDEELTAIVKVTKVRPEKHLVDLETTCKNARGELICTGHALVYVGDVAK